MRKPLLFVALLAVPLLMAVAPVRQLMNHEVLATPKYLGTLTSTDAGTISQTYCFTTTSQNRTVMLQSLSGDGYCVRTGGQTSTSTVTPDCSKDFEPPIADVAISCDAGNNCVRVKPSAYSSAPIEMAQDLCIAVGSLDGGLPNVRLYQVQHNNLAQPGTL